MPDATLRIPGFANAHSHAFQRALRGRVERVDPGPSARRLLDVARGHVRRRERRSTPSRLLRRSRAALRRDAWPPGTRRSASSTTPTTSRDGTPYPDRNAMAKAVRRRRQRRRHRDRAADVRLRPRRARGSRRRERQRRFCDPTVAEYLSRVEELAVRVPRRPGAAQRAGAASRLAGGDRRLRGDQRDGGAHPRQRAAARGRRVPGRARHAPDRAAGRHRPVDRRTTVVHATHVTDHELDLLAAGGLDGVRVPDHRGEPGRRLPAGPPAARAGDPDVHRLGLEHGDRSDPRAARDRGAAPGARPSGATCWYRRGRTARPDTFSTIGTANGARALGFDGPVG